MNNRGCVWPDSPTVDPVMAEERAAAFGKRSIKRESKMAALKLAISMLDLTTLEGADTPEKVRGLCRKAVRVWERDEEVLGERLPSVAAVCVYPSVVGVAREAIDGGVGVSPAPVKVASVATGFPSGQYPLSVRIADVRGAIRAGADEIDMVINRGAFLSGRHGVVLEEIREIAMVCASEEGAGETPTPPGAQPVHLKVILETGELGTLDNVRRASDLAICALSESGLAREAGAAFIKTSTGKVSPAATMPVTLVMLHAIRDHYLRTGEVIGMKPAGGIRTAKQAVAYLVMVAEEMGTGTKARRHEGTEGGEGRDGKTEGRSGWLSPSLFRFGASSLANDLVRQVIKQTTGRYAGAYDVSEAYACRGVAMRRIAVGLPVCLLIGFGVTVAIAWYVEMRAGTAPGIGGAVHFGMSGTGGVPGGWLSDVPEDWPRSPFGTAVISNGARFNPATGTLGIGATVRLRQGMGNGLEGRASGVGFSNDDPAHVLEVYRAGWPWHTMERRGIDDSRPRAVTWVGRAFARGVPIGTADALPLAPMWPGFWLSVGMWAGAAGLVWIAAVMPRDLIRGRRKRKGCCLRCGYALGELTVCPECGAGGS